MKRWKRALAIFAVLLLVLIIGPHVWIGYRSPEESDHLYSTIERKHYPFRHWQWSGIPVAEGGFIPDPHYLWSEIVPFPAAVNAKFGTRLSRYAVIDVNPFFNDASSEILLVIEADGKVFQYSLTFPQGQRVQAVLDQPTPPSLLVFPDKDRLVLLAGFFGAGRGAYLLPLPLKGKQKLSFIPARSPEFLKLGTTLEQTKHDDSLRAEFCNSGRRDFIAYYEKFASPCGEQKLENGNAFQRFWYEN